MGSARVGSNPIFVVNFFTSNPGGLGLRPRGAIGSCGMETAWRKKFRYRELNPGHLGESQVS